MRKLDIIKKKDPTLKLEVDQTKQVEALDSVKKSIDSLHELINGKKDYDFDLLAKQLVVIGDNLDFSERFEALQLEVKELGDKYPKKIDINGLNDLIKAVKENKVEVVEKQIDITKLEKAIIQVTQAVRDTTGIEQAPEDYQPVRRVIRVGRRLVFDDSVAKGVGGGGSSDQGASNIAFGSIDLSASGANTLVSGQSGKRIRVLSVVLVSAGTVSVTWKSASTALSGAIPLIANTGFVLPASSPTAGEYIATASGEALVLTLSGNVAVTGHFTYYIN